MDLNVKARVSATYLVPIAVTLRKVYAPSFDIPDAIALAVAKVEAQRRLIGAEARVPLAETRPC